MSVSPLCPIYPSPRWERNKGRRGKTKYLIGDQDKNKPVLLRLGTMYVIIPLLLIMPSFNLAALPATAPPAAIIGALDCRAPSRTRYARRDHICHPPKVLEKETVPVLILQASEARVVTGYKCTRHTSTFVDVCAVWGHIKRYGPPEINVAAPVSVSECHRLVSTGSFTKEDGRQLMVPMNTRQSYQIIRHGHLYLSTNDVACQGSSITIGGEAVQGIVMTASSVIGVEKIDIEVGGNTLVDLSAHSPIPDSCRSLKGCMSGTETYIIPDSTNDCPLYTIRVTEMQKVQITTKEGTQNCLVNEEHKLLFMIGQQEPSPAACGAPFTTISTQYSHLKLVTDVGAEAQVQKIAAQLPASSLDLDLEVRSSEEYMTFRFETLLSKNLRLLGENLCNLAAESIVQTERSPFSPTAIIRARGDVVQELQCTSTEVTARLGDSRSKKCHPTAFPVWMHNQPGWLETGTHVLVDEPELAFVDCKAVFPPFVITKEDQLLVADPFVRNAQLPLQSLPTFMEQIGHGVLHEGFSQSLLYTSEEVTKFNNLVHFSRTRARVVDALTHRYCEKNSECGEFSPPSGTSSFDLKALQDDITHPWSAVWTEIWHTASQVGSVCSLLVAIYVIITTCYKVFRMVDYVKNRRVTATDAMRLVFFPGNQIASAMWDLPGPAPACAPEAQEMTQLKIPAYHAAANQRPPTYPGRPATP